MKLGFIGLGVVGDATWKLAKSAGHKEVEFFDPGRGFGFSKLDGCDVVFISVPVPTLPGGKQDLTILEESLARVPQSASAFIRSTVLPGTCEAQQKYFDDIDIFSMPEFLTERQAEADSKKLPIVCSREAANILRCVFPNKEFLMLTNEIDCEFVKYMHNAFCAVKVGFFNIMEEISRECGIAYPAAAAAACIVTGFIEPTHTKVPGPDGKRGFGGKCLPKDLLAFAEWIKKAGLGRETFLNQVLDENFRNRFESLF